MEYYDDNDKEYKEVDNENREDGDNDSGSSGSMYGTNKKRPAKPTNGMAVASMVCGIVGTLMLCGCIAFPLSIILGVVSIFLAFFSKKGQPFSGYAIAGLVLGIISLILGIAEGFYIIMINVMLGDPKMAPIFDQLLEQYNATTTQ